MGQYSGLLENIFQMGSNSFSLWELMQRSVEFLDESTGGLFLGLCVMLPIVTIYQKTDSLVAIYGLLVISLNLFRMTIFEQASTLVFYIIIMIITITFFKLYTTSTKGD